MTAVVDASALLALALDESIAPAVERQLMRWVEADERVCAPLLAIYEVFSAITCRAIVDPTTFGRTSAILSVIRSLTIEYVPPNLADHRTVEIAVQLQRSSAYDAAYIALAEQLDAELWTLDRPLHRNATSFGCPVRLFA